MRSGEGYPLAKMPAADFEKELGLLFGQELSEKTKL